MDLTSYILKNKEGKYPYQDSTLVLDKKLILKKRTQDYVFIHDFL